MYRAVGVARLAKTLRPCECLCAWSAIPTASTHQSRSNNEAQGLLKVHGRSGYSTETGDLDILGQDAGLVRIDSCVDSGFVVGEQVIPGAILAYGGLLTTWHVEGLDGITADSVKIVDVLKPAPDLLVLGTGANTLRLPKALAALCRDKGMTVEVAATGNAVATFNILNQEGRKVVGAFLPVGANRA